MEEALVARWRAAADLWPQVAVDPEDFVRYLAERIPAGADPWAAVAAMHTNDLYLACACTRGEKNALPTFERTFMVKVPAYLARADAPSEFVREVEQRLRTRLFVTEGRDPPRIAGYSGRGPLGAWVRMTALRVALNLRDAKNREGSTYELRPEAFRPADPNPELAQMRQRYGVFVAQAIEKTLAALSGREATLLRLFFLRGMSYESIGRIYRVSRSKARRWIVEIQDKVLAETRRTLADELELTGTHFDTLIRLVSADLGTSVVQVLKRPS